MAEQVPAVGNILSYIERRDWARLEQAMAPHVHWTTAVEEDLFGPAEVIASLRVDPVPGPPAFHEVGEDGRLVRWVDKMG
ncbi:hypothetical protein AFL01nite_20820 [Aeromicrobium flavum]|uniref:SnoaL-like domain-containing protein n=1 Tax=Aeromicrobium flavum TaxID=416568 RepID=A0A512HWF5_9ACTN|nr:hypothetical protein [Aeromicrobium flavum]GEO89755.1 hypothetical protein AFL01nite_20820 [Aeromicrobium flavum]